jgi:hypothetical protein
MKKPTKRRKRTIRQTSDRVSRFAARLIALHKSGKRFMWMTTKPNVNGYDMELIEVTEEVLAVAGSALNQDQTRGPRKARRK